MEWFSRWLPFAALFALSAVSPTSAVAALLHNAIEDQEVPRELIEREFGKRVAEVVSQVTDDKTQPKETRKEDQVKTAGKKSNDAKIIKLADKTSNMRAITYSPAPNWSVKRRLEYYRLGQRGRERSARGIALARTTIRPCCRRGRKLGRRPK